MFGCSMPTPLAMPVTVTRRPSISVIARGGLRHGVGRHDRRGRVGPVRRAQRREALRQRRLDPLHRQRLQDHAGRERQHFVRRCSRARARPLRSVRSAARSPASPVPQFALPALVTSARIGRGAASRRRQTWTGAAAKPFRVNTPATRLPGASRISMQVAAAALPDARRAERRARRRRRGASCRGVRRGEIDGHQERWGDGRAGIEAMLVGLADGARRDGSRTACRGNACTSCPTRTGTGRCARPCRSAARTGRLPQRRDLSFGFGLRAGADERLLQPGAGTARSRAHAASASSRWISRTWSGVLSSRCGEDARDFELDRLEHRAEQLERLALVLLLRVLLRVAAQVDTLAQVVERGEVLAPVRSRICSNT